MYRKPLLFFDEEGKINHNELLCFEEEETLTLYVSTQYNEIRKVYCKTNYPVIQDQIFCREHYNMISMEYNTIESKFMERFILSKPGAYSLQIYFFPYNYTLTKIDTFKNNSTNDDNVTIGPILHFIIQPKVEIDNTLYPLSSICLLTVMSRCMGSIIQWNDHLKHAYDSHYNAIHLTPLQTIGSSNSNYSISNFTELNNFFFPKELKNDNIAKLYYLHDYLDEYRKKYKLIFINDIILNHASPDCQIFKNKCNSYNTDNTPQLLPSLHIDLYLQQLSKDIINNNIRDNNGYISTSIDKKEDICRIICIIKSHLESHIHEYYMFNKEYIFAKFSEYLTIQENCETFDNHLEMELYRYIYRCIYEDRIGEKFPFNVHQYDSQIFITDHHPIPSSLLRSIIDQIQKLYNKQYLYILNHITQNLFNTLYYRFIESPNKQQLSSSYMLVENYFNMLYSEHDGVYFGCNNGWNMSNIVDTMNEQINNYIDIDSSENSRFYNDEYIKKFCKPLKIDNLYMKREIIIWGDCVKLRYDLSEYKDNSSMDIDENDDKSKNSFIIPNSINIQNYTDNMNKNYNHYHLKTYMIDYIMLIAYLFDGIRIDNAHNTNISLLTYFVDIARTVNPSLIILSELFTSDHQRDIEYVSTIGINLVIRESIQSCIPSQMTYTLYNSGGYDIGTFRDLPEYDYTMAGSCIPCILFDLTHDNQSYYKKFSFKQSMAISALLSLSPSTIGSTKGFDECYIDNPSVLEHDCYAYESHKDIGINRIKSTLNTIHQLLSLHHYSYRYVHHYENSNIVCVQRFHSLSPYSVLCISCLDYEHNNHDTEQLSMTIDGRIVGVFIAASMDYLKSDLNTYLQANKHHLKGIKNIELKVSCSHTSYMNLCTYIYKSEVYQTVINISSKFKPGSFVIYLIKTNSVCVDTSIDQYQTINDVTKNELLQFSDCCSLLCSADKYTIEKCIPLNIEQQLNNELNTMTLYDYSYILFTTNEEEKLFNNQSTYHLDMNSSMNALYGTGQLPFAGIASLIPIIEYICKNNDISHPLVQNIRNGDWLIHYILHRIQRYPLLYQQLKQEFDIILLLPRSIKPFYVCKLIYLLYKLFERMIYKKMNMNLYTIPKFVKLLSISTLQFLQDLPGYYRYLPSAGLPHFQIDWKRVWGRDTFISFKGLYLDTYRYDDAKQTLLIFAKTLYNGLIPNLFDNMNHPRYNSRDSIWWYIYALSQYCDITKDYQILYTPIERIMKDTIYSTFQNEIDKDSMETLHKYRVLKNKNITSSELNEESMLCSLMHLIHKVFIYHLNGIHFREDNSISIDNNMQDNGFNVDIYTDIETGFIMGGNIHNCGTWMDKMGSSSMLNSPNKGIPATPRDGCAIEIVCLCAACLQWIDRMIQNNQFEYDCLPIINYNIIYKHITYGEWLEKIKKYFYVRFYIPTEKEELQLSLHFDIDKEYVFNRGIYKDVYKSTFIYPDYQFRCNQIIGMSIAPFLFPQEQTSHILQHIIHVLFGKTQLGIKTLSENDLAYRPTYINRDNVGDSSVNCGQSYHNGPEWIWPVGYLIQSIAYFAPCSLDDYIHNDFYCLLLQFIDSFTKNHMDYLKSNIWLSLPELTQRNGDFCSDSCQSQCWSITTILDAYHTIYKDIIHREL